MKTNQEIIKQQQLDVTNAINDYIQKDPSLAYMLDIKKFYWIDSSLSPPYIFNENIYTFGQLINWIAHEYRLDVRLFRKDDVFNVFAQANRVFSDKAYIYQASTSNRQTYLPYNYLKQYEIMREIECNGHRFPSEMAAAITCAPANRKTYLDKVRWLENQLNRKPKKYFYIE